MGGQGLHHRSRLDFWHQYMVALLLYLAYIADLDLG